MKTQTAYTFEKHYNTACTNREPKNHFSLCCHTVAGQDMTPQPCFIILTRGWPVDFF